jgi:hypothetical protein
VGGVVPAASVEGGAGDRAGLEAGLLECVTPAEFAFGWAAVAGVADDQADGAVPVPDEVLDSLPCTFAVLRPDARGRRQFAVDRDDRHVDVTEVRILGRRDQDQPAHLTREQFRDLRVLGVRIPVRAGLQNDVPTGRGLLVDRLGELGEQRIPAVRSDQAEGPSSAHPQRTGGRVRPVAEHADRLQHPVPRLRRHPPRALVHHVTDHGRADPGVLRDVVPGDRGLRHEPMIRALTSSESDC